MVASFTVGTRKSSNVSNAIAASYMYRFTINLFFVWLPGLFHVHSYLGCLVNHVFRITCLFCSHHSTNLFPLPFILPIPLLPTMSSCFCFTNSALEDPFITIISINDHFCHFHFLYHFHWHFSSHILPGIDQDQEGIQRTGFLMKYVSLIYIELIVLVFPD